MPTSNSLAEVHDLNEEDEILPAPEADEIEENDNEKLQDIADVLMTQDIDALRVRRKQGRPKGTPDYKLPVVPLEGEFRKAEIVAALTHLYYLQDRQFAPDNIPLHHFQTLLNVSRHTLYRCIEDVKRGQELALRLLNELQVLTENMAQAERARKRRARQKLMESQARIMQRRIYERRLKKAELKAGIDPDTQEERKLKGKFAAGVVVPPKIAPKRRQASL